MISILLVDDHSIVRAGFKRLLEGTGKYQVIAEAKSGQEGYSQFLKYKPDIIVLDISMEGLSGFDLLNRILDKDPSAKVVMLSMFEDHAFVARAINSGARGYITKSTEPDKLFQAMQKISMGERWVDPEVALNLVLSNFNLKKSFTDNLTPKEFEVFGLLSKGESVADIAQLMNISEKTVGTHRTRLMEKLQLNNLAELARLAIRHNIITP